MSIVGLGEWKRRKKRIRLTSSMRLTPFVTFGNEIKRPTSNDLRASFPEMEDVSVDSSVTVPCTLCIRTPFVTDNMRKSDLAISLLIDDGLSLMEESISLLGVQHAWNLCRRCHNGTVNWPFQRIQRIWFFGLCMWGKDGGEYRPAMVRRCPTDSWQVKIVPACDYYYETDCLALGRV